MGTHIGSEQVILFSGVLTLIVVVCWLLDPVTRNIPATVNISEEMFMEKSVGKRSS